MKHAFTSPKGAAADGTIVDGPKWNAAHVPESGDYAFSDLSGNIAPSQLIAPSSSAFGGVKSLAAVATKFLTAIGTDGIPVAAQPANLPAGESCPIPEPLLEYFNRSGSRHCRPLRTAYQ